jgi:hypothetical protein
VCRDVSDTCIRYYFLFKNNDLIDTLPIQISERIRKVSVLSTYRTRFITIFLVWELYAFTFKAMEPTPNNTRVNIWLHREKQNLIVHSTYVEWGVRACDSVYGITPVTLLRLNSFLFLQLLLILLLIIASQQNRIIILTHSQFQATNTVINLFPFF